MKYGIQLFGAQALFREDPMNFFETVAEMGYSCIEPCIVAETLPPPMVKNLWKMDEIGGFLRAMESLGLSMISCHAFGLEDRMVEIYEKFGPEHFVAHVGGAAENFEKRADELCALSEKLHAAGAQLWLHNGAGDCVPGKVDGLSYYEALLRRVPYIKAELDNGWAVMDGADQYALMEKLGDALGCLHVKEMARGWENKPMERRFALPGEGISDFSRLMKLNGGRPVILDEDYPVGDWFDDFRRTIKVLRENA
jgi:sugar phosphate isomerase/epimerase